MIKAINLSKLYGSKTGLEAVNIHVEKGSVYGLVGPNGAGKTTLIKILAGIYRATSGEVTIAGNHVDDNKAIKERIYYMPDDLYFERGTTIVKTANYYKALYKKFDMKRYELLVSHFGIDERQSINKLSKGMKKQVSFILGLSTMPDVMVLDEPIDGLDPVVRKKVWSLILQDVAERKMTVLISSHNLKELEGVCDTVGVLHEGRLLLEKEMDDLKSDCIKVQIAFEIEPYLDGLDILHLDNKG